MLLILQRRVLLLFDIIVDHSKYIVIIVPASKNIFLIVVSNYNGYFIFYYDILIEFQLYTR